MPNPHPEEPERSEGVSKDEGPYLGLMVRDAASRLLTMRVEDRSEQSFHYSARNSLSILRQLASSRSLPGGFL
jgi:hypothetical protein